jgi:hypothetical protein
VIPLLAVVTHCRGDMLCRFLKSVDHPVGRLVVVRTGRDVSIDAALVEYSLQAGESWEVWNMHYASYSQAINSVVARCDAPYWIVCNDDIMFPEGSLREFEAVCRESCEDNAIVLTPTGGFGVPCFTKRGIRDVGTMDENFYPCYFEDCDWMRRMTLSGAKHVTSDVKFVHGVNGKGTQTCNANPDMSRRCSLYFSDNREYYVKKWGGEPGYEKYASPFNGDVLWAWRYDFEHIRKQRDICIS